MTGLTERQTIALEFIRSHLAIHGSPPTLREIGARMGIGSTNGVNDHLRALERKGFIARRDMKSRGIQLIGDFGQDLALGGPPPSSPELVAPPPADRAELLRERVEAHKVRAAEVERRLVESIATWLDMARGTSYDRELAERLRSGAWRHE
jgi:SOS-response transcriptional repressor LexA